MKSIPLYLLFIFLTACNDKYHTIDDAYFQKLTVQDTLLNNNKIQVFKVGNSTSDKYPHLVVNNKETNKKYLFEEFECELANDSIIHYNITTFIYDEFTESRKNGMWVYTKFYTKGTFPFKSNVMEFSPDSIPQNWKNQLPTKEGIYYYKNNNLILLSNQQSDEKFKEKEKNGFYFIPNKGRLFDKINIYDL